MVVITSRQEQRTIAPYQLVLPVLQRSWDLHLVNVIALTISAACDEVDVFTYTPYSRDHCEQVHPIRLCRITNDDIGMRQLLSSDFRFWFPEKLSNLHGCPLYVATNEWDPYMMITVGAPANIGSDMVRHPPFNEVDGQWVDGIEGLLLQELSVRMRFTLKVLFARVGESSRGMELENGSFTGIMGMVCRFFFAIVTRAIFKKYACHCSWF